MVYCKRKSVYKSISRIEYCIGEIVRLNHVKFSVSPQRLLELFSLLKSLKNVNFNAEERVRFHPFHTQSVLSSWKF